MSNSLRHYRELTLSRLPSTTLRRVDRVFYTAFIAFALVAVVLALWFHQMPWELPAQR